MAKRIKVEPVAAKISSYDEANEALAELQGIDSRVKKAHATYNEAEAIRRSKLELSLRDDLARQRELEAGLEKFAMDNRADFEVKKSRELTHGILSFRKGNPTVAKIGKITWDGVLEVLNRSKLKKLFVRTKDEINKEAILAEAAKYTASKGEEGVSPEDLHANFIKIEQTETFGYELKPAIEELAQ